MSRFLTPLVVTLVDDQSADGRGTWELVEDLVYESEVAGCTITVPKGFRTDFASVPRQPIVFLACGGRASRASVPHDWGYTTHCLPKEIIDKVFLEAMLVTGVPLDIAHEMYNAVSLFGGTHWTAPNSPQSDSINHAIKETPCSQTLQLP